MFIYDQLGVTAIEYGLIASLIGVAYFFRPDGLRCHFRSLDDHDFESHFDRARHCDLMGLIGCPSFRGVMAVLTVRALWGLPVSGPLALAANIPVILSIPADGGHHFVDVAGEILVAFLSAAFANAILRRTKVKRHQGLGSRGALTLVRQALQLGKI